MVQEMYPKCITLSKKQILFLEGQRKTFNFSKFVRDKFDKYMNEVNKIKQLTEVQ